MTRLSYKTLFTIVVLLSVSIVFLLKIRVNPSPVKAEWWNDAWTYRQAITITIPSSTADFTDLDTNISIGTSALVAAGKLQSDCDDLRFTNINGQVLPYFIDSGCNTAATKIWLQADLVPKNTTTYTVYVYYGNPSAAAASDSTTFNLYNGLVGYWNFNENTGTSAANLSFNTNSFTMASGTTPDWLTNGKYGVGVSFNGSSQSTTTTLSGINSSAGAYNALSFWMYWNGINARIPISFQGPYDLYLNTSTCVGFNTGYSDIYGFNPTSLSLSGRWSHFVMNFYNGDYTGHNEIYVDGVKQTLSQCMGTTQSRSLNPSSNLVIGNFANGGNYFFGGALDDIRVYNRYLTASDVSKLYYSPGSTVNSTSIVSKPTVSFAAEELGGGPIAWWKFDEGVGTSVFDSSGHNNTSTLSGATWKNNDQCISNKCLLFSATNQYVTKSDSGTSDPLRLTNGSLSFELWMNQTTNTGEQKIIDKRNQWNGLYGYSLFTVGTIIYLEYGNGSSYTQTIIGTNPASNQWHHIGVTLNGSTILTYIDGKLTNTTNGIAGVGGDSTAFTIGYSIGRGTGRFQGLLDDIKIYPYARTATQIKQDYAAGLAGQPASNNSSVNIGSNSSKSLSDGLVAYYKFDEGVGTSSADSSGNSNTATFGTGSSAPTWSSGKYGIGLSFDRSNEYLDTATSPTLTTGLTWSAGSWVYLSTTAPTYQIILYPNTGSGLALAVAGRTIAIADPYIFSWASTGVTLPSNTWTHVFVTSGNNTVNIYKDGVLMNTLSRTSTAGTNTGFKISYALSDYSFMGKLDEVRVYNRALNATEVKALYNYAPGPVGYWKFDEGVGTTAYDSSGNSNNGIFGTGSSSPSWVSGKIGKATNFNGTSSYLNLQNELSFTGPFTLSAWLQHPQDSYTRNIVGGAVNIYNIGPMSAATVECRTNTAQTLINLTSNFPFNNWYHFALQRDLAGNLKVFINGVDKTSGSYQNTGTIRLSLIGARADFYSNSFFIGQIDDVKIYNYARTQSQILEDMGSAPASKSPILWYKFDEGQGTITNNSGIGGTLTGTFGAGNSSPTWTDGKFNKALNFGGDGDYLSTPDSDALDITGPVTLSFWIKSNNPSNTALIEKGTNDDLMVQAVGGTNAGMFYLNTLSSTTAPPTATQRIFNNQWHHVVAEYDGTNKSFFVDGILYHTNSAIAPTANSSPFTIGSRSGVYPFTGQIDDIKVFNYALTLDEIKQEYNQGAALVVGASTQTIGATVTSLDYCIPGDTSPCSPPIAEWKFDEGTGTTAFDTSGNGNNAVFGSGSSAPSWAYGKIGKGLNFNGTSNYLDAGTNPLVMSDAWTIEAWVKPTDKANATLAGWQTNTTPPYVTLQHSTTGQPLIYMGPSNYRYFPASAWNKLKDGNWHHVAFTMPGASLGDVTNSHMYLDGVDQVATTTYNPDIQSPKVKFTIGQAYSFFGGSMDQFRYYNYVRTPAQIAYDYNQGGPIGWWKFDECQGSITYDSSGIGNTGSINIGASGTQVTLGTCSIGDTSAWSNGKTGKLNSSLNFDGTDDYINLGSLSLGTIHSLSYWINYPVATNGVIVGGGVDSYFAYTNNTNSPGSLYYATSNGNNVYVSHGGFTPGQWYFITITRDGTALKFYKNGLQIGANQTLSSNLNLTINYIGKESDGYFTKAQLDDVRVYNYALTATQVKNLYNGGALNFR